MTVLARHYICVLMLYCDSSIPLGCLESVPLGDPVVCSHIVVLFLFFFFFSSRRRHTRLQGDWSSDVCSSDLVSHSRGLFRAGTEPQAIGGRSWRRVLRTWRLMTASGRSSRGSCVPVTRNPSFARSRMIRDRSVTCSSGSSARGP